MSIAASPGAMSKRANLVNDEANRFLLGINLLPGKTGFWKRAQRGVKARSGTPRAAWHDDHRDLTFRPFWGQVQCTRIGRPVGWSDGSDLRWPELPAPLLSSSSESRKHEHRGADSNCKPSVKEQTSCSRSGKAFLRSRAVLRSREEAVGIPDLLWKTPEPGPGVLRVPLFRVSGWGSGRGWP